MNYLRDFDDYDLELYSRYVSKLAAVAAPGDPPPLVWRAWFHRQYDATPGSYRQAFLPGRSPQNPRGPRASLRGGRRAHDFDPPIGDHSVA